MKLQDFSLLFFHFLTPVSAHFSLWTPVPIGANVTGGPLEGTGPCGSFDITNRDTVTDWPLLGYPVYLVTTHPKVVFEFRAALVNDTTEWVNLIPPINQEGLGLFCEPAMPGFGLWTELPVVLQIAQYAPDGINYQVRGSFKSPRAVSAPSVREYAADILIKRFPDSAQRLTSYLVALLQLANAKTLP